MKEKMHEVNLTKGKIIFIYISTVLPYICHITGDISILSSINHSQ